MLFVILRPTDTEKNRLANRLVYIFAGGVFRWAAARRPRRRERFPAIPLPVRRGVLEAARPFGRAVVDVELGGKLDPSAAGPPSRFAGPRPAAGRESRLGEARAGRALIIFHAFL